MLGRGHLAQSRALPTVTPIAPSVPGPAGSDGSQVFVVSGVPDPTLGGDKDVYLDPVAKMVYTKVGGSWGVGQAY